MLQIPGRARTVRLDGEIDLDQQRVLRRVLEQAPHEPPPLVVLDLPRLGLCDVTGRTRPRRPKPRAAGA
ncbi:STAS domain-containing protein [Kitasatospora griseola]|uniref:hypothetical protein n=1 Tax=Kitasatospora griseola TaxID=2064 RepID=UPI00366680F8